MALGCYFSEKKLLNTELLNVTQVVLIKPWLCWILFLPNGPCHVTFSHWICLIGVLQYRVSYDVTTQQIITLEANCHGVWGAVIDHFELWNKCLLPPPLPPPFFFVFFFRKRKHIAPCAVFFCILDRNLPAIFLMVHFLLHAFIAKHLLISSHWTSAVCSSGVAVIWMRAFKYTSFHCVPD